MSCGLLQTAQLPRLAFGVRDLPSENPIRKPSSYPLSKDDWKIEVRPSVAPSR
jgi:hypothetical protein